MIQIQLGDKVKRTVRVYDSPGNKQTEATVEATVVYIHPERRYFTLRYDFGPGRSFCESEFFPSDERETQN